MSNNINNMSIANQMKIFMKRMRSDEYIAESFDCDTNKDLGIHEMLKLTRKFNVIKEDVTKLNKKTIFDQNSEEEKFKNYFNDLNVSIKLIDLEVYDDLIFWGGTIDGIIQFVYKVTQDESTSGVEFNYLKDFSPDNPENDEIINRVESYYDIFYKYWRNNMLNN